MYGCVNSIHHEIRLVAQATIYRWISYWKSHSENQVGKLTTNKSRPRHRVVQMVRMHQQLREQKQPPGFGRRLGDGLTYGWRSCSTHIWHAWNGLRGFNGMVFSGFIAWGTWKIREACDLMDFWPPNPTAVARENQGAPAFLKVPMEFPSHILIPKNLNQFTIQVVLATQVIPLFHFDAAPQFLPKPRCERWEIQVWWGLQDKFAQYQPLTRTSLGSAYFRTNRSVSVYTVLALCQL